MARCRLLRRAAPPKPTPLARCPWQLLLLATSPYISLYLPWQVLLACARTNQASKVLAALDLTLASTPSLASNPNPEPQPQP